MLRMILFVWACYACTSTTLSQGISYQADELADPVAAVNHALQHIDLSSVSSQLLLDRTLPLAPKGVCSPHTLYPVMFVLGCGSPFRELEGRGGQ